MKISDWEEFENKVADFFKLLGYDVIQNTKLDSAQTDSIAQSQNRFKQRILIECKYHKPENKRSVGIDEVENFKARVLTLRMKGKVDQGYLVTNTKFTASAKESIGEMFSYVFLTTLDELIFQLIDVDYYLKENIKQYELNDAGKYVDLRIVDIKNLIELNFSYAKMIINSPSKYIASVTFENIPTKYHCTFDEHYSLDYYPGDVVLKRRKKEKNYPDWEKINTNTSIYKRVMDEIKSTTENHPNSIKIKDRTRNEQFLDDCNNNYIIGVENYIKKFLSGSGNLLVLFGDFGSGKTTSLRHLMYQLSKQKITNPNNPQYLIPLFISLRNYNKVPDIDSLLINFFNTELGNSNINIQVFKKMNELGYFIIILDGFDEMARLVTPIERRLTFIEICKLITTKNKVILSSRPGYFPDNKEFSSLLKQYVPSSNKDRLEYCGIEVSENISIGCVQLMDDQKVTQYLDKNLHSSKDKIYKLLGRAMLKDLMTRPVLINILAETYSIIEKLDSESIDIRKLYEIYTNKWINREQDKGLFRILQDPQQKSVFISLLAIQMQEQERLSIHFSELDGLIQTFFGITDQSKVDHFSHDIRTCSFLNRNDSGYYSFIHKSFLEYLVAKEFCLGERSQYRGGFSRPFTPEIVEFIDLDILFLAPITKLINDTKAYKNLVVKSQRFELAAAVRDLEKRMIGSLHEFWHNNKSDTSALLLKYDEELKQFKHKTPSLLDDAT